MKTSTKLPRSLTALDAAKENHPDVSHYTVFGPKNVFRPVEEVVEIHNATGEDVKPGNNPNRMVNLIAFRPDRIAKQLTIAAVNSHAQIKDEGQFANIVSNVYSRYVVPQLPAIEEKVENIRQGINKDVKAALKVTGTEQEKDFPNQALLSRVKETRNKIEERRQKGHYTPQIETIDSVTEKYLTDCLYNESDDILKMLKGAVAEGMQAAAKEKVYTPLSLVPHEGRKAYIVSGGPASGKSTMTERIVSSSPDFFVHAADRLRPLVKPEHTLPEKSELANTSFTDLESNAVFRQGIGYQMEQFKTGKAPTILIETTSIHPGAVGFLSEGGAKVHATLVSVPAEVALDRAKSRAENSNNPQDKGRFLDKSYLLNVHKQDGTALLNLLEPLKGKNVQLDVYDNNVRKEESPTPVASIDFRNNTVDIYDLQLLMGIEQKGKIDPEQKKNEGMYSTEDKKPQNNIAAVKKAAELGFIINYSEKALDQIKILKLSEDLLPTQAKTLTTIEALALDARDPKLQRASEMVQQVKNAESPIFSRNWVEKVQSTTSKGSREL